MFGSCLMSLAYLVKKVCLVIRDIRLLVVFPVSELTTSTLFEPYVQLIPKFGALI